MHEVTRNMKYLCIEGLHFQRGNVERYALIHPLTCNDELPAFRGSPAKPLASLSRVSVRRGLSLSALYQFFAIFQQLVAT